MGLLKVKIMQKFEFFGVVGYKNNSYITKKQGEPILVDLPYTYDYEEDTTIYVGSHTELLQIWQYLTKDTDISYINLSFVKDVDYCIVVTQDDPIGDSIPRLCKVNEVNWGYYENITSWYEIDKNKEEIYLAWLLARQAWKEHKKKVN